MFDKKFQGYALIALMLIMTTASIPIVKASEDQRFFTATITPTVVFCDSTVSFTITVCNDLSSDSGASNYIGSAKINIPSGFTGTAITNIAFPVGKTWTASMDATHILLQASDGDKKLARGDCVSVTFNSISPTPVSSIQSYEWTTHAFIGTTWTSSESVIICPGQPIVSVACPATTITTETVTTATTIETPTTIISDVTVETPTTIVSEVTVPTTIETPTTIISDVTVETPTTIVSEVTVPTTIETPTTIITTVTSVSTQSFGPAYVIIGTPLGPIKITKPAGTISAAWIDATASSIFEGMLINPQFSFDTNNLIVDPTTGQPLPGAPSVFVMSGGPFVNGPVKYYETNYATEGTPVHFGFDGSNWAFYDSSNTKIPDTSTNPALIGANLDYFLIESFVDSNGNNVLIAYGYFGRGTFASALYFKEVMYPSGGDILAPGVKIVKWEDKNGNGLPDISIDAFTVVYNTFP
jgi:hypothetical protein